MGLLEALRLPHAKQASAHDDRQLTLLHKEILSRKGFLRKIYAGWYRDLMSRVPDPQTGTIVELGSGPGFIKEMYPRVQTSDVLELPGLDRVIDAAGMPFANQSIDAILMIDVLHHMKNVEQFFTEAGRVLKPGGRIAMIEPANTPWARFVYSRFHHEPFEPAAGWQIKGDRPLSDANDALAWIIFTRDRTTFENKFPRLRIISISHHTPIAYLLSGGFTLKQLVPTWMYVPVRGLERCFGFCNGLSAMFQTTVLEKRAC